METNERNSCYHLTNVEVMETQSNMAAVRSVTLITFILSQISLTGIKYPSLVLSTYAHTISGNNKNFWFTQNECSELPDKGCIGISVYPAFPCEKITKSRPPMS